MIEIVVTTLNSSESNLEGQGCLVGADLVNNKIGAVVATKIAEGFRVSSATSAVTTFHKSVVVVTTIVFEK